MKKAIVGVDPSSSGIKKLGLKGKKEVTAPAATAENVVSVPSNFFTVRNFQLPFLDKRRLKDLIREELSDRLLFPISEGVWDFITDGKGQAVAFVARLNKIEEFKKGLSLPFHHLEPESLCLLKAALANELRAGLIIDLGHSKTLFLGIKDGFPNLVRILLKGGNELTRRLAEKLKISLEEAEELKKEKGTKLPEVREYLQELFGSALLPKPFPYPEVFLSGGGAELLGLREWLKEHLGIAVEYLPLPEGLSPFRDAVAYGAALPGKVGENTIEFFQVMAAEKPLWQTLGVLLLMPFLLFSFNLKLAELNLETQNKAYNKAMRQVLKLEFPQANAEVAPFSQFKAKVQEEKKTRKKAAQNPLEALSLISETVKGKKFKIFEINLDESGVDLKGEAPSFKEVEDLREAIKSETFKSVELIEGKTLPDGKIKFHIQLRPEKA